MYAKSFDHRRVIMESDCNSLQVLKFYTWEPAFESRILDVRQNELKQQWYGNALFSCNQAIYFSTTYIVSRTCYVSWFMRHSVYLVVIVLISNELRDYTSLQIRRHQWLSKGIVTFGQGDPVFITWYAVHFSPARIMHRTIVLILERRNLWSPPQFNINATNRSSLIYATMKYAKSGEAPKYH